MRIGGFYRVPTEAQLRAFAPRLEHARELALETVRWVAGFDFPDHEWRGELAALRHPGEYAITRGRLVSTQGLDIGPEEFEQHVVEEHVEHSTALHARLLERGEYVLGPLARFTLNHDELTPVARDAAAAAGLSPGERNTVPIDRGSRGRDPARMRHGSGHHRSLPRARPTLPSTVQPRAGVGYGWTEAPRGMLWHRYELDDDGSILSARIVPPTSQNQAGIERDLFHFVEENLDLSDDELGHRAEQVIRSYDPCISCATHFLDLTVDRS